MGKPNQNQLKIRGNPEKLLGSTYRVLGLVVDQLLAMLDPLFVHQWILYTVDDLQKESLPLKELSIGHLY